MSTTTLDRDTLAQMPGHEVLGVGARFSLAAMTDGFIDVIVGALADADASDLSRVETDEVSTYVGGSEQAVLTYLRDVLVAATRRAPGVHLSTHVLLSRGCPGSVVCELPADLSLPRPARVELDRTGVHATAHWSLYPLGASGHMPAIERAIDGAEARGTLVQVDHHATKLGGDIADVLATVANGWIEVGKDVQHVTTHLTLSVASPSHAGAGSDR